MQMKLMPKLQFSFFVFISDKSKEVIFNFFQSLEKITLSTEKTIVFITIQKRELFSVSAKNTSLAAQFFKSAFHFSPALSCSCDFKANHCGWSQDRRSLNLPSLF